MLSRLALRNTRKSFGDFAVYFLTLMFGVMAFYAFGSIDAQAAMLDAESGLAAHAEQLAAIMDTLSMVVAVVLAFLVVYANGFLIKRRKREFGTYLILGMTKRQVGVILIVETLLVGVAALAVGLALGVAASQGLSVLTAGLFEMDMSRYRFVFSPDSALKTVGFFTVLFLGVSTLNLLGFSRQTVGKLLNASKRREPRVRRPAVSIGFALLGLVLVAASFWSLLDRGLLESATSGALWAQVIAGSGGTFLLFAGGSGLVLRVLQSNRGWYLRGLNPFVVRQLDAKMSSTYATMAIVSITLFFAVIVLAGGMSFGSVLNKMSSSPLDASFIRFGAEEGRGDITGGVAELGLDLESIGSHYEFYVYESELPSDLVLDSAVDLFADEAPPLDAITLSDANAILRLQAQPEMDLEADEFAIMGLSDSFAEDLRADVEDLLYTAGGREFHARDDVLVDALVSAEGAIVGFPTLVLSDDALDASSISRQVVDIVYTIDNAQAERDVLAVIEADEALHHGAFDYAATKTQVHENILFIRAIVTFIGLYVGLILLVTSAAILALQQLSEASDSRRRYTLLSKIGADDRSMSRAVRAQVSAYFGMPLLVALAYAVVSGRVVVEVIDLFGDVEISTDYNVAIAAIVLVFGGYYLATMVAARRMVLER